MLAPARPPVVALSAKVFRGLGDPSRLAILEALCHGPLTVGEIVRVTGLSQPNASNHLACLRDCGLVVAEPQGRFVRYRLGDERVGALLTLAADLLAAVATGVEACPRFDLPEDGAADRHRPEGCAQAGAPSHLDVTEGS